MDRSLQEFLRIYTENDTNGGRKLKTTLRGNDLTDILTTSDSNGGRKLKIQNDELDILVNNEIKVAYFAEVSAATGAITVPTGATILLNQFAGGVDALVSTVSSSQPTGDNPVTSGGVTVDVSSFDAVGNYTLSGTPSAYPVALIYILKIKAIDWPNLNVNNILEWDNDDDTGILYGTTSGTDTYTTTINGVSNYVTGQVFAINFGNANTGSSTLNVNSLSAKTLKKNGSTNLSAGDISAGQSFLVVYDGTNFQVIGLSGGTSLPWTAASASGAASLDFAEDTDNGTNKATLKGQASLSGDITVTLPSSTGTLALTSQLHFDKSTATSYTSSSTTTNEVAAAFLIPAGTTLVDACIKLLSIHTANSSANTKIVRWYANTTGDLTGSPVQLSTLSWTTGGQYTPHYREFFVRSNTSIFGFAAATSSIGDLGQSTSAPAAITIPTLASDVYIIATVNRANSGDTLVFEGALLEVINTR